MLEWQETMKTILRLNKQMQLNAELKKLKKELEEM